MKALNMSWRSFVLFVAPAIVIYVTFFIFPVAQSLWYSVQVWGGFGTPKFVGLQNYLELLQNRTMQTALTNTFVFMLVSFAVMLPLAFLLANSLVKIGNWFDLYGTIIYLPCMVSTVATAMTWDIILNNDYGVVNGLLRSIGVTAPNWLGDMSVALFVVIAVNTWQWTGLHALVFYGAIRNVPKSLYEAAELDGASGFQQLRSITVPLVKHATRSNMLLIAFGSLKAFDAVFILTNGGPIDSTQMPALYMYQLTFNQFQFGQGAAIAVLIFVLAIIAMIVVDIFFRLVSWIVDPRTWRDRSRLARMFAQSGLQKAEG